MGDRMNEPIFPDILKQLIAMYEQEYKKDGIHITSLVQCLRKAYYDQFAEPDLEHRLRRPLFEGTAIHKFIEYLVEKYGSKLMQKIQSEVEIEYQINGVKIIGRADAVLDDRVVEIKTTTNLPKKPYPSHVLQANTYAYILKKPKFEIIYIGDYGVTSFVMKTSKEYFDYVIERAKILMKAFRSSVPPEKEPSILCPKCRYYHICFKQMKLDL